MPCRTLGDPWLSMTTPVPSPAVEQHRDHEPVSERDANGGRGLPRRDLLVDLLDRDQVVLTVGLQRAQRAVGEPDLVLVDGIARHVAGPVDVVEDDDQRWSV
jgi:hypothetical protein